MPAKPRQSTVALGPALTISSALLLLAAAACGPGAAEQAAPRLGAVAVSVNLAAADVATLSVTVSAPDIASPLVATLTSSGGGWSGTVADVPAGAGRTVRADAKDASGTLLYQGTATGVTVSPGATAAVVIVLQQVTPPPPNADTAPVIVGIAASSLSPVAGEVVTLTVTAHDADAGAVLSYLWTATGGAFTPAAANAAQVQWTVPSPNPTATYSLTVKVTDDKGLSATASFDLGVPITPGLIQLNATVNSWPVVTGMTATPTSVAAGSAVDLSATTSDADGDTVTVAWSADCAGAFSAATGASTRFTPSAVPSGNLCTVTATATDGRGGTATGSRGVWVGLGTPPWSAACVWTQVLAHDLATAPPGAVWRNGLFGTHGPATVYGRTAWLQAGYNWDVLLIPTGLAASDDIFAVESDVYVPSVASGTLYAIINLFTKNQTSLPCQTIGGPWAGPWIQGGATNFQWWLSDPSTCGGPITADRKVTIPSYAGAWRKLRIEGSRSRCKFTASFEGVISDTWTPAACTLPGGYFGLQANYSLIQSPNVAWSNFRVYKGTPACAP